MSINNGDVERRYEDFCNYCLEAKPDIVAVQEVSTDVGWPALRGLARALGADFKCSFEHIYTGQEDTQGVAVVSNATERSRILDTGIGKNKIQILDIGSAALANVHLEAHLFKDIQRLRKIRSLKYRLNPNSPQVLAGDFNAIPHFPSIKSLKRTHRSAYSIVHGREPAYTYPTDLGEQLLLHNGDATKTQIFWMKQAASRYQAVENRRPTGLPRIVADYVFVSLGIQVKNAKLTGHDELHLAHSDHRGLEVDFAIS